MKKIFFFLLGFNSYIYAQDFPVLEGEYFGQTPSGDTAVIFAPGIISQTDRREFKIAFSPDGTEIYFSGGGFDYLNVYYTKRVDNIWSEPVKAPDQIVNVPFIPADGNRLYFNNDSGICMVERTDDGWGEPQLLPAPINSTSSDYGYIETAEGVVYIYSKRPGGLDERGDIWCIHPGPGQSLQAENLGSNVNSAFYDCDPCIAPDESFLIFSSGRPGGYGNQDLYICFNKGNNEWTAPVNMERNGVNINIAGHSQVAPSLSHDGRYLFFGRHNEFGNICDIYWISTKIIDDIRDEIFSNIDDPKNDMQIPGKIKLNQNYPNPFNSFTTIRYSLSYTSYIKLAVHNLFGREVQILQNGIQNTGDYSLTWDATDKENTSVSSGIYFYSLQTNDRILKKKMILIQ